MKKIFNKKILYLTINGVLEPLGESQISNYINKLSKDYKFYLISFEKNINFKSKKYFLQKKNFNQNNIDWHPLKYYSFKHPLQYLNIAKLYVYMIYLIIFKNVKIIHVRSLIPGIFINFLRYILKFNFIYDLRGFWVDEKIDRLKYKNNFIMKLCNRIDKKLILNSKFNIFLTKESKNIVNVKFPLTKKKNYIITTASSEELFNHYKVRNKSTLVNFLYLGTTYGAYNFNSIIDLLKNLFNINYKFTFTIYTKDNKEHIKALLLKNRVLKDNIQIFDIDYKNIHKVIKNFDFLIFSCFENDSIKASMPTKIGESLLSGVPILCNDFNDDISQLINNDKVGIIIDFKDYDIKTLTYKINNYLNDDSHKVRCRLIGEKYFSLSNAVKNLDEIYNSLCKKIYQ